MRINLLLSFCLYYTIGFSQDNKSTIEESWMPVIGWFDQDSVVLVPRKKAQQFFQKHLAGNDYNDYGDYIDLPPNPFNYIYKTYCPVGMIIPKLRSFKVKDEYVEVAYGFSPWNDLSSIRYYSKVFKIMEWTEDKITLISN